MELEQSNMDSTNKESLRSTSARAKGDAVIFEISKEEFNRLLRECPEMSVSILKEFSRRIRKLSNDLAKKNC